MFQRKGMIALAFAVASLFPAATAQGVGDHVAKTSTIVIGSANSLSGPATFPAPSQAAKAVFDRVNRGGGINGTKIRYVVKDDGFDSGKAATAVRQLVGEQKAVAMVGGGSLLDCAVNSGYYKSKGVVSIMGLGIDPVCFASPSIAPVNTGPYYGIQVTLQFLAGVLKKGPVCFIQANQPGIVEAAQAAANEWAKKSGNKLEKFLTYDLGADPTPVLTAARNDGCRAIAFDGVEPTYIGVMQAAQAQGMTGGDYTWAALTTAYTDGVASKCGSACNGLYVNSEFEPYTGSSRSLRDFVNLMKAAHGPQTSDAEAGYLAAMITVKALKSIKGPITRAKVTKALRAVNYSTPLLAAPFRFGSQPNKSSKFVQLNGGQWKTVNGNNWVTFPAAK